MGKHSRYAGKWKKHDAVITVKQTVCHGASLCVFYVCMYLVHI